jgi:nicotinamide-nucleotide amidase
LPELLNGVLPEEVEARIQSVLSRAAAAGLKIATAESCTGGLVSALLTDVPGLSHVFERGFVVYSPEAKNEMLGVPLEILEDHGAVSEAAAIAMAQGALARSNADIVVALTGFAGAAGADDQPGLVHFATICCEQDVVTHREIFGDAERGAVRLGSVRRALEMLDQAVAGAEPRIRN